MITQNRLTKTIQSIVTSKININSVLSTIVDNNNPDRTFICIDSIRFVIPIWICEDLFNRIMIIYRVYQTSIKSIFLGNKCVSDFANRTHNR